MILLCTVLLSLPCKGTHAEALVVCLDVAAAAQDAGESPELLVALAYMESRMDRNAVSSRGAVGPLQVIPRYWPGNPITAGMTAWKHWRRKGGSDRAGIAMYNAGRKPGPRAYRHAARVLTLAAMLEGFCRAD